VIVNLSPVMVKVLLTAKSELTVMKQVRPPFSP
jgi:hypothetical protein